MKKVVLKLDLHDEKAKQKAMKTVSGLSGVDSIAMDMNERKLTVIGNVDAVDIVSKLRKQCYTELLTVGPAKEEKKDGEGKKEEETKKDQNDVSALAKAYQEFNPHLTKYTHVVSAEDYNTGCVIC